MGYIFYELIKKMLVKKHGTDSCKRCAEMPTCELTFSLIRNNVERDYSKYKDKLPVDKYEQFIEEIFQIHKDYKLNLDKADEKSYGKIYGDCAQKIVEVKHKYGIKG